MRFSEAVIKTTPPRSTDKKLSKEEEELLKIKKDLHSTNKLKKILK